MKKIVLYRNGEKDPNFKKSRKALETPAGRSPSSKTHLVAADKNNRIRFQTVDGITCLNLFALNWVESKSISCVLAVK